jgi:hypothetical protein
MSSTACLVGFEHRVEAAQHGHRQDDVAVLAADVEVAQDTSSAMPQMKLTIRLFTPAAPSTSCAPSAAG